MARVRFGVGIWLLALTAFLCYSGFWWGVLLIARQRRCTSTSATARSAASRASVQHALWVRSMRTTNLGRLVGHADAEDTLRHGV
jgi:hypothetical protein